MFWSRCLHCCAGAAGSTVSELAPTPTLDAVAESGRQVYVTHCGACHSTSTDTIIVGRDPEIEAWMLDLYGSICDSSKQRQGVNRALRESGGEPGFPTMAG